uniref:AA_TRNA_LIGASE_II domain-containing protein n=1 Tax=Heterorhabditis bacteriophora TaxID=37862 RepID=A0A1I7XIF2_HETBA
MLYCRALRLRSEIVHKIRRFLIEDHGFIDVETPTLFRRTPGGAAEFLVPAAPPNQGKCYSLPQSPQQFKQLLMIGAIDRYFQIARCYRDEGSKGDRQPEFTQVDLELSFTNQDAVMQLVEDMIISAWPDSLSSVKPIYPFPRMKYSDAMRLYGTDKPDMRIPWVIEDCTDQLGMQNLFSESMRDFLNCFIIGQLRPSLHRSDWVARLIVCRGQGKHITESRKKEWQRVIQINDLGRIMAHWVVDFPLFSMKNGKLVSTHHPFTAPIDTHKNRLQNDQKKQELIGQHYDLVINGVEIGGGSIRIHSASEQINVLETLGENVGEMAHLLEALSLGAPPHGGFALGLDRFAALLVGNGDSSVPVREVIAFPKSKDGRDLMSGAPVVPVIEELNRYRMLFQRNAELEENID